ncbi:hypothetical protein JQ580_26690 [Bradyrhizobium japonicum]|nr:hypothetical protein [Bradyrhizobium japonicum]
MQRIRLPRLRPITTSWRRQLADHEIMVRDRVFRAWVADERVTEPSFMPPGIPDVPRRPGSMQSIQVWRPRTLWHDTHPDDQHLYTEEQLSEPTGEEDRTRVLNRIRFAAPSGSEQAALVAFETEAQEKADIANAVRRDKAAKARAAKLARRAERHHKAPADLVSVDPQESAQAARDARKFADEARDLKQETRDRLQYGPYFKGGRVAGEVVPEMHEYLGAEIGNNRSRTGSPSMARIAALSPRKGRTRAGYEKDVLFETTSKLFALDAPYVELNKKIIGCIVVELDSVLRPEQFRERLLEILGPRCMPNLIVGRISESGFLVRPHLIWLLKKPVWNDQRREIVHPVTGEITQIGDKRCKTKPIRKAHVVQRCLTQLLLPLGADPAMTNMWKPKNALSFFWTTLITNDDHFYGLTDFEQNIIGWPSKVDEHAMAETAADMRAKAKGVSGKASNLLWRTVGHIIEPMARDRMRDSDPEFIKAGQAGVDALAAWFDRQVRPVAREALLLAAQEAAEAEKAAAVDAGEETDTLADLITAIDEKTSKALDVVLERRCRFHAKWCLGKLSRRRRKSYRGRDRNVVFEVDKPTPTQHREKAGQRTAEGRSARSAWALAKEIYATLLATGEVRRAEFIRNASTVCRATAYRRWDEAMRLIGLVECEAGVWRNPPVSPAVSLGDTKIKSQTSAGADHPTSLPSDQAGTPIATPTPTLRPGHPVQTDDPPRLDTADPTAEPGDDAPPWSTHALPTVDVRRRMVSRVPEPEPA